MIPSLRVDRSAGFKSEQPLLEEYAKASEEDYCDLEDEEVLLQHYLNLDTERQSPIHAFGRNAQWQW